MARRRSPSFGFSFSWRRALGISQAQGKLSRAIGIPLSKSGRQRKLATAWIDPLLSGGRRRRRKSREADLLLALVGIAAAFGSCL